MVLIVYITSAYIHYIANVDDSLAYALRCVHSRRDKVVTCMPEKKTKSQC